MPYSITDEKKQLRVTLTGKVSGSEIETLIEESLAKLAPLPVWPNVVADLRAVDLSGLGIMDMMGLAKRRNVPKPPNAIKVAIVSESPTVVGYARMAKSFNPSAAIAVEVFSELGAAATWLSSPAA